MVLVVQVIVGVWAAWVGWGRGESRAKLGVSESKSEETDSEVLGLRETSRRSSMPLGKRPGHRELVSWINGLICFTLCHALFLCLPPLPPPPGPGSIAILVQASLRRLHVP